MKRDTHIVTLRHLYSSAVKGTTMNQPEQGHLYFLAFREVVGEVSKSNFPLILCAHLTSPTPCQSSHTLIHQWLSLSQLFLHFPLFFLSTGLHSPPSFSCPSISPFAPHTLSPLPPCVSSCGAEVQIEFLWAKSGCLDWAVCQSGPSNLWYSYLRNFPPFAFHLSLSSSLLSQDCFSYQIQLKRGREIKTQCSPLLVPDKKKKSATRLIHWFDRRQTHTYSGSTQQYVLLPVLFWLCW